MTVFMHQGHRRLPRKERYPLPPAEVTADLLRRTGLEKKIDRSDERFAAALATHFGYGALCGGIYSMTLSRRRLSPTLKGSAFGLLVWTWSYLGFLPGLKILKPATQHPWRRNAMMIAAHFVWGSSTAQIADRTTERTNRRGKIDAA